MKSAPLSIIFYGRGFSPFRLDFYSRLSKVLGGSGRLILDEDRSRFQPWSCRADQVFDGKVSILGSGPAGWVRYLRIFRSSKPDLLVTLEYGPASVVGILAAKSLRIPVIVHTEVGGDPRGYAGKWYSRIWRGFWSRFTDGFLCVTKEAQRFAKSLGVPNCLVPHAVSSTDYEMAKVGVHELVTFLFVGQLIHRKGVDLLIAAGDELARKFPGTFIVRIVGSGELQEELKAASVSRKWLKILGFREGENLICEYRNSDVFVLPTREDTFALVVHEAACVGLPLIVSENAGASEVLVKHGSNGFVVSVEDESELVSSMMMYLESKELLVKHGRCSHLIASKYSVENTSCVAAEWMRENFDV